MVVDNADDLDMFFPKPIPAATDSDCTLPLRNYLPQSSTGSMLITTRDERVGTRLAGRHASIVVNPMSPQEAQELLNKWQTEPLDGSDLDDARNLLDALEYLPLAITQAAAFISENHITLIKYLEMFRKSDSDVQDLLDEEHGDLRRDFQSQNSVIKTWKMSFDLITKRWPRAAEMLSLMAFLDRQGIPESLLRNGSDRIIDVTIALGTLQAFSLIKAGRNEAGYEMHRLVQLATQRWLKMQATTEKWQGKALSMVATAFPSGAFETRTTCESLLPHAERVIQYGDTNGIHLKQYSDLLSNLGRFDHLQGRLEMARVRISAAIDVQEKCFGLEHSSTLRSMNNLAVTYEQQGRWEEAEKLLLQVLDARKRVLGAEHQHTSNSMNNLAVIYEQQGRWEEAEKLHIQVLDARKRVLGAEHQDTLSSMNNLAVTYRQQGRWEEAEKLLLQVLDARKRVLGAEHQHTSNSMNNLAVIYEQQGRWEEAEKLHLQVLDATKRVLGAEHQGTLSSMNNLAVTYRQQGQWEEAEKLHIQVLDARKRVLGAEHPDTLRSMHNLAFIYEGQGRRKEAIALMDKVVEIRTRRLGANHPDTIESVKLLKKWSDS